MSCKINKVIYHKRLDFIIILMTLSLYICSMTAVPSRIIYQLHLYNMLLYIYIYIYIYRYIYIYMQTHTHTYICACVIYIWFAFNFGRHRIYYNDNQTWRNDGAYVHMHTAVCGALVGTPVCTNFIGRQKQQMGLEPPVWNVICVKFEM